MSKSKFSVSDLFSILLVLILFALVFGFFFRKSNNINNSESTFYVKIDDSVVSDDDIFYFVSGESYQFDIFIANNIKKYDFDIISGLPSDIDFVFTVDGVPTNFSSCVNLKDGFTYVLNDNNFIIQSPGFLLDVLNNCYPGKDVQLPSIIPNGALFKIVLTNVENESINIYFSTNSISSIVIDKDIIYI